MVVRITRAITGTDLPFTPQGQQRVDGVTLYTPAGMGQRHFYFRVDDRIY